MKIRGVRREMKGVRWEMRERREIGS